MTSHVSVPIEIKRKLKQNQEFRRNSHRELPLTGAQERIKTAAPTPSLSATTLSMV